jgi:hypothetical protein
VADTTYQPKVYKKDGGDTLVIAPGGSMENQDYGAVTQITSAATGVTLSKLAGTITTVALTTAAAAEESFVVTNTKVAVTDVVAVSTTYAGGGTPIVAVKGVAAGSFSIVITNLHATAALDAVAVINFYVLKANT